MGATDWRHIVAFQPDLTRALADLHRAVLAAGAFAWANRESPDDPMPATLDEARDDPSGTHSVLDIAHVIAADAPDGHGTLRPLTAAETVTLLGAAKPTRADFERAYGDGTGPLMDIAQRWSGYALPLYEDGAGPPSELAIWGYSGD